MLSRSHPKVPPSHRLMPLSPHIQALRIMKELSGTRATYALVIYDQRRRADNAQAFSTLDEGVELCTEAGIMEIGLKLSNVDADISRIADYVSAVQGALILEKQVARTRRRRRHNWQSVAPDRSMRSLPPVSSKHPSQNQVRHRAEC